MKVRQFFLFDLRYIFKHLNHIFWCLWQKVMILHKFPEKLMREFYVINAVSTPGEIPETLMDPGHKSARGVDPRISHNRRRSPRGSWAVSAKSRCLLFFIPCHFVIGYLPLKITRKEPPPLRLGDYQLVCNDGGCCYGVVNSTWGKEGWFYFT